MPISVLLVHTPLLSYRYDVTDSELVVLSNRPIFYFQNINNIDINNFKNIGKSKM